MSEKKSDEKKAVIAKPEKKKEPISLSKVFATIIIVLITVALVGTSVIYVIIPSINKKNEINFGSYDGEKILYEANSLLYQQYMAQAQANPDAAASSDLTSQYSLWRGAYENAVVLTAIKQIAEKSGVRAPQALIDQAILESGYFNDDDGNFSEAEYNAATNETKISLNQSYKQQVPFSIISADEGTTQTAKAEEEFVADMASATRTFEYIPVNYSAIPDTMAQDYMNANATLFKSITISEIATSTKENIDLAFAELEAGTAWADVVAKYSEDSYASAAGSIGQVYYYNLSSSFTEEQLEKIFSTEEGKYTLIDGTGVYRIIKVDAPAKDADYSDGLTVAHIKNYILTNEAETAAPYVEELASKVAAEAKEDFDEAAINNGLQAVEVGATPANIGGSNYMGNFSYTDAYGLLATAAKDESVLKTLYTAEAGYVSDPIKTDPGYIIVKVAGTDPDITQGQTVNLFYSYYGSQMATNDFYSNILSGEKHNDQFMTQFFKLFASDIQSTPEADTAK